MAEVVKGFLQGIMNKDADERVLPEGQYRDALNIEVYNQEGSSAGSVHNKLGNTKIVDLAIVSGRALTNAKTIGAVTYEANNLIYWLVACDTFDGIYEYNTDTQTAVRVIQSNKATANTISKLGFRKEYPVTGINYIPGRNGNNYLYWTDDYNQPRRINITRTKSYQIDDDRIDNDINVVIKPPLFAPAIYPYLDTTDPNSNNMKNKFLEFAYRWKNIDGQYSATSPFSAVSFKPGSYAYDYGVGNNKSMVNAYNAVRIAFETGDEFVDEIQLILKDTRSPNANIIESISKSKLGIGNNQSFYFEFKNNKTYAPLPIDQVTRLFDNVPLLAGAQDVIGNRLAYGDYTQFRDLTDVNGAEILVDYNVSLIAENTATEAEPKQTWRSDRDVEVGVIYGDDYGRMTTVVTSANSSLYIPPANSTTANKLKLQLASKPPSWATNYRVVIKQSKGEYYNVFPITFYSDGLFRYFLIHQSDIDKIKVGEYVIFKQSTFGATNSNKKYKILEIDAKSANFITGGTTTEIEGTYFKIKVDSPTELNDTSIIDYNSLTTGWTSNFDGAFCSLKLSPEAVLHRSTYLDDPIYYGNTDPSKISIQSSSASFPGKDSFRVGIEGNSDGTISYYIITSPGALPVYVNQNITPSSTLDIYWTDGSTYLYTVNIASGSVFNTDDKWIIMYRNQDLNLAGAASSGGSAYQHAAVVMPGANWGTPVDGADTPIFAGAVIRIKLEEEANPSTQQEMVFPPSPSEYENIEEWWYETSASQYFKFYKYDGSLANPDTYVRFNRGMFHIGPNTVYPGELGNQVESGDPQNQFTRKYPMRLMVRGSVFIGDVAGTFNNPCKQFFFKANFSIRQSPTTTACETVPLDTDLDIYHEVFQTHEIVDGNHTVLWNYDDYISYNGNTMLTQLSNGKPHYFNVGDSIYVASDDNFYMPSGTYDISQIVNQHSVVLDFAFPGSGPLVSGKIKYAGSYEQDQNGTTSNAVIEINKPNNINSEYNAWTFGNGIESDRILDDWNETTKQFSVRAYSPFEGYKQVRNGASICYSGVYSENSSLNRLNEFNLSTANFKHLEKSFGTIQKLDARDTDLLVYQENKISQVLYGKNVLYDSVGGGQITSIPEVLGTQIAFPGEYGISKNPESFSKYGKMRFFTDSRRGLVLQLNGDQIIEISNTGMSDYFRDLMNANPNTEKLGAYDPHNKMYILTSSDQQVIPCQLSISKTALTVPKDAVGFLAFSIVTDLDWTISLVDLGSGTSWVTDYTSSGYGSQNIYAQVALNNTLSNRTVKFVVTYCDGLTQEFILTQAKGIKGKVIIGVLNNDRSNALTR